MKCYISGSIHTIIVSILLASSMIACGGGGDSGGGDSKITLKFATEINGESFSCGQEYKSVGSSQANIVPLDARYYVSDISLIADDGSEHELKLTNDGKWQDETVALLDFEDGTGTCTEGDGDTNTQIIGTVENREYVGIQYTVGVPFNKNHSDAVTALPPLDRSAMYWNWNAGYKFVKFDVSSSGMPDGYRFHLGSTACAGNESGPNGSCQNSNRISVRLDGYNPSSNTIVADFGILLSENDLNFNTPQTAPGCMSGVTDPECAPLFSKLGLSSQSGQQLFHLE